MLFGLYSASGEPGLTFVPGSIFISEPTGIWTLSFLPPLPSIIKLPPTTTVFKLAPNSVLSKVSWPEPISNFERSETLASFNASNLAIPVLLDLIYERWARATPPKWNVLIVNWVPGSPIDWAAIIPTGSPISTLLPVAKSEP